MQKIRRIGVVSLGKTLGVLYAALGICLAPVFFLMGAAMAAQGEPWSLVGVVLLALLAPVLYGLMGLLSGLLVGALYNAVSGRIGGIEVELTPTDPIAARAVTAP